MDTLSAAEAPVSAEQIGDVTPLSVAQMYRRADLSGLPFQTTAELEPVDGIVGQKRRSMLLPSVPVFDNPGSTCS